MSIGTTVNGQPCPACVTTRNPSIRVRKASPTPVARNKRTDGKVQLNSRTNLQNMSLMALHHLHDRKKIASAVGAPYRGALCHGLIGTMDNLSLDAINSKHAYTYSEMPKCHSSSTFDPARPLAIPCLLPYCAVPFHHLLSSFVTFVSFVVYSVTHCRCPSASVACA
jgi:hypothetical protein